MKSLMATLFILGVFLSGSGLAQQADLACADQHSRPARRAVQRRDSRAAKHRRRHSSRSATDPKKVQAYNELALAFLRRARETADPKYLKDADAALAQGLKLDPADFQLQKNSGSPHVESS